MLTAEIVAKEVIGSDGYKLGKIRDTQFDERDWQVLALEVQLEKDVAEEHHLRHRFRKTRVLISVDHVQAIGDRVVLKGSKDELLKLIASSPVVGSQGPLQADEQPSNEAGTDDTPQASSAEENS